MATILAGFMAALQAALIQPRRGGNPVFSGASRFSGTAVSICSAIVKLLLTRTHGRVTIREAARVTGVSRHKIKDHVKKLVAGGHLTRHGAGRGTWYSPA